MDRKRHEVTAQEIDERLIEFASRMIDLVEALPKTAAAKHLGKQLLRSGASPALHYGEAQVAASREDFFHEMTLSLQALRETLICLKLIARRSWFTAGKLTPLLVENHELVAMFIASTKMADHPK